MEAVVAKINGRKLHFNSRQDLARYLMDRINSPLAPFSSKVENLYKIMELTGFDKKAHYIGKITNGEIFERAYWETLLSLEYMGTLPGFSVIASIEKGASNYDPEKRRMSTDWTLYDDED